MTRGVIMANHESQSDFTPVLESGLYVPSGYDQELLTPDWSLQETRMKVGHRTVSIVLAGGGATGLGWNAGALKGIEDFGVDVRDTQMLGTSAGSGAASFAAAGIEFEDVAELKQFGWPGSLKPGFLEGMYTDILGDTKASNVEAMVWRMGSLDPRHKPGLEKLSGAEVKLAKLAAASCTVPFVFSPVRKGPDFYVDGGVGGSMGHIRLAPEADDVMVVAPMAEHFMPPLGQIFERHMMWEMDKWQEEHDGNVVYLRPNREIAGEVANLVDVFNVEKGKKIYNLSRDYIGKILDDYVGDRGNVSLEQIVGRLAMHKQFTTKAYFEGLSTAA
tara:strand:+ start:5507 stop:6499 length:993 start_codon:yes stop_codon:yes gene_type:complete